MSAQRDPAILLAFVDEARSYLPGIRDGLLAYLADENQASEIQSAYRLTHTIAGAASMVGLDELSAFARSTENILEEFALVGGPLSPDRGAEVLGQLDDKRDGDTTGGTRIHRRIRQTEILLRERLALGDLCLLELCQQRNDGRHGQLLRPPCETFRKVWT